MELLFEWDANKARENLRKHKVSFEEAKTIFMVCAGVLRFGLFPSRPGIKHTSM